MLFVAMFIGMATWGMGMHDGDGTVAATPTFVDQGPFTIQISDFSFDPSNVSVPAGTTITWENEDAAPHDAAFKGLDDLATDLLRKGDTDSLTFNDPGTYEYYCTIHPGRMTGSVIVRESDASPSAD